jgi:hypothetical protein
VESPHIPRWVPKGAASRITERLAEPGLTLAVKELLTRLATYDAMKTEVWGKLPPNPPEMEGRIIDFVCLALNEADGLRPPWPRKREDVAEYLRQYPTKFSYAEMGRLAEVLGSEMTQQGSTSRTYWDELWPGDPRLDLADITKILSDTAEFYNRLGMKAAMAARILPPAPRKRRSKTARQTHFGRIMSRFFEDAYHSPLDPVVTALTGVAFDLSDGPTTDTIRGRRRTGRAED